MMTPQWVQAVLERFDSKTEPHDGVDIAQALSGEGAKQGDLSAEERKAFLSEWSVFYFMEGHEGTGAWGTYFAPMVEWTQGETTVRNPDIAQLDAETITYWRDRALVTTSPVMKARYADAAWDFANVIANGEPNYKCALMAIDGYVEATTRHFYTSEIEAVQWLVRALHLARCVRDANRIKNVVDAMFAFYQLSLDPRHVGGWIFLFDNLYGEKKLISTSQEAQIISDLETMLGRLAAVGEPNEFDPYGAQAAAERLIQHYKKQNDTANVERVTKAGYALFRL